jgi:predicted metalloprotease with PDZ domain
MRHLQQGNTDSFRIIGVALSESGSTGVQMKAKDFEELVDSVREAGRILRGEAKPSREFSFSPEDARALLKIAAENPKAVEKALGRP